MAPSAKYLSFLFLLFLISSPKIHAREISNQFFSKFTRHDNNNNNKETQLPESTEEPTSRTQGAEEQPSFTQQQQQQQQQQNHNGFGLYGHGSEQFSPNSVNDAAYYTPTNEQYYTPAENYGAQKSSFSTGYPTNNYNSYENKQQQGMSDNTKFMDKAYLNNNNYRYGTKQQQGMMRDYRYSDDTAYLDNNNNNYYNGNGNGNAQNKQQGMSDTRFMENGKYFYDVNNAKAYHDRYHNQYEESPKQESSSHNVNGYASSYEGVHESRKNNRYNNYGGYYNGNNANTYDFTNSMDGFQNQNEQFQESQAQEEYVP